mmetsp:Transcript_8152/g.24386  ORF Transcript_8152/g.24386 Transcript_8152/m.24386 type:complete len:291 (-) Transcript_8152:190-1062(-)
MDKRVGRLRTRNNEVVVSGDTGGQVQEQERRLCFFIERLALEPRNDVPGVVRPRRAGQEDEGRPGRRLGRRREHVHVQVVHGVEGPPVEAQPVVAGRVGLRLFARADLERDSAHAAHRVELRRGQRVGVLVQPALRDHEAREGRVGLDVREGKVRVVVVVHAGFAGLHLAAQQLPEDRRVAFDVFREAREGPRGSRGAPAAEHGQQEAAHVSGHGRPRRRRHVNERLHEVVQDLELGLLVARHQVLVARLGRVELAEGLVFLFRGALGGAHGNSVRLAILCVRAAQIILY